MPKSLPVIIILAVLYACKQPFPANWPVNGTELHKIVFHLPIEDSLSVLQKEDNYWILPSQSDSTVISEETSFFRNPEIDIYSDIIGRVDQEVVHSSQPGYIEYYRFDNGDVLFLGFASQYEKKALTIFDPPLIIMPSQLPELETSYESVSTMKNYDKTKGEIITGDKVKLIIKKIDSGIIKDIQKEASLFEMKIASDKTIKYGESGLVVPELVILESKLLIGNNGTLLEWEIKSRAVNSEKLLNKGKDLRLDSLNSSAIEAREYFIEVTKILQ